MNRILVALGGNALGDDPEKQLNIVRQTAKHMVDLIEAGYELVISHGNGPQVGMISLAMEGNHMPLPECVAMSQGYIGYHLQNGIGVELRKRNIKKAVVSLITQVIVNREDEAFNKPSKPIGKFYTKEEAIKIQKLKGYTMMEDANRGYRRAVPSPKPIDVVEKEAIKSLLEQGHIVIAGGGGGVPVVRKGDLLVGVDAVIDKDLASALIAKQVDADCLLILTAVDRVAINFGKPDQINLDRMTVEEAYKYMERGEFAPGSMLPKVMAAIDFVESKKGRQAIIASLGKVKEALGEKVEH